MLKTNPCKRKWREKIAFYKVKITLSSLYFILFYILPLLFLKLQKACQTKILN